MSSALMFSRLCVLTPSPSYTLTHTQEVRHHYDPILFLISSLSCLAIKSRTDETLNMHFNRIVLSTHLRYCRYSLKCIRFYVGHWCCCVHRCLVCFSAVGSTAVVLHQLWSVRTNTDTMKHLQAKQGKGEVRCFVWQNGWFLLLFIFSTGLHVRNYFDSFD